MKITDGNYVTLAANAKFISYHENRVLNVDKIFRFYKSSHENDGVILSVIRFQSESGLYENLTFDDPISRDIVYERICRLLNCIDIEGV